MNRSKEKRKRDKLVTIRINANLYKLCLDIFKSQEIYRGMFQLTGSFADLVECLLQDYKSENLFVYLGNKGK
jgi:hypothetical protein